MKAFVLASLLFSANSVFAQIKEFGAAKCNVTTANRTKTLEFKIVPPMVANPAGTSVAMKNLDGTFSKISLSVMGIVNSDKYSFTILVQKANTVRDVMNGYFTGFLGTTTTVKFPFAGKILAGSEYDMYSTANIDYACTYQAY